MNTDVAVWLFGAPQFWLGVISCAALVLLAVTPTVFRPRRTVRVYRSYGSTPVAPSGSVPQVGQFERAPVPPRDPFCKPALVTLPPNLRDSALRRSEKKTSRREPDDPFGRKRTVDRDAIREARKRAVWHPHPDDELPAWRLR